MSYTFVKQSFHGIQRFHLGLVFILKICNIINQLSKIIPKIFCNNEFMTNMYNLDFYQYLHTNIVKI